MARFYTAHEASQKLGCSSKTFARWVNEARIESIGRGADGRERLYSYAQLKQLAKRHGRVLQTDAQAFSHDESERVAPPPVALPWAPDVQETLQALRVEVARLLRRMEEREQEVWVLREEVRQLRQALQALHLASLPSPTSFQG